MITVESVSSPCLLAAALLVAGCGDNQLPSGQPIPHADTLFVAAHLDDDMIFMQPELLDALARGSVATIYVATGDPVGIDHAASVLDATKAAYAHTAGISRWDCGYIMVGDAVVQHCRASDRPVSLIALDLADGGVSGDKPASMLHLVDGTLAVLPVLGRQGGGVTTDSTVALMAELLTVVSPREIHALELAGTHGHDHSSHMFSSAFLFWGAASIGYAGPITWHRGYNVDSESETFGGPRYDAASTMLGYFEACAYACGPCGTSCTTLRTDHETWLRRQYAETRRLEAQGVLAIGDACLTPGLRMGDCTDGVTATLLPSGQLRIDDACVTSTNEGGLALAGCASDPAQYWMLDSDGSLWNGARPSSTGDMTYTHVRCLAADGTTPTCGDLRRANWRFAPPVAH